MRDISEEVQNTIDLIDEMLLDEEYIFASDFLENILDFAKENDRLTEAQIEAVYNIYNSKNN